MEAQRKEPKEISLVDLVGEVVGDVELLLSQEAALARQEMREAFAKVTARSIALLTGATLALYGLLFIFYGLVYLLGLALPIWVSALIIGGSLALIGLMAMLLSMRALTHVKPLPRTTQAIREDLEWLKQKRQMKIGSP